MAFEAPVIMEISSLDSIIACHDCDLVQQKRHLEFDQRALCMRCGAVLYRRKRDSLNRTLSLTMTALVLLFLANVFPFMSFSIEGRTQETVLLTGVKDLYLQGFWPLALLVFSVGVFFPLLKTLSMMYMILPLKFGIRPKNAIPVFRLVEKITPWSMMEVYLLGVLVAYVKLIDLATIGLGAAFISFVALIIVTAAADMTFHPEALWDELETTP